MGPGTMQKSNSLVLRSRARGIILYKSNNSCILCNNFNESLIETETPIYAERVSLLIYYPIVCTVMRTLNALEKTVIPT